MTGAENDRPDVAVETEAKPAATAPAPEPDDGDEGARLLAELGAPLDPPPPDDAEAEDTEHITPRALLAYSLAHHDSTLEQAHLPSTLLATFSGSVYHEWVTATGAQQAPQVPAEVMRVAQGKVGEREIAIRKLGIGAPAAVTVLEELIALGVRDILVVGTGGSLQPALPISSYVVPTGAIREEGTSFHYAPAGAELAPDPALARALAEAMVALGGGATYGPVWTTDAPYREMRSKVAAYSAMGALAVEMEASALFALAQFRGVRLALLIAISDELFHEWQPGFRATELRAALKVMAAAALQVAATLPEPPTAPASDVSPKPAEPPTPPAPPAP